MASFSEAVRATLVPGSEKAERPWEPCSVVKGLRIINGEDKASLFCGSNLRKDDYEIGQKKQ